jgi:hypothetical protein
LFKDGFHEKVAEVWQWKQRGRTLWRDGRTKLDPFRDISGGGQKT